VQQGLEMVLVGTSLKALQHKYTAVPVVVVAARLAVL
jgi:hypothetical protein